MPERITIQRASARTGLSTDTLRYYEKLGIVTPVRRNGSGHREYSEGDLKWIGFIQNLLATGLALRAVQAYMALARQGDATALQRIALLEAHAQVLEGQIGALQTALVTARHKIAHHAAINAAWAGGDVSSADIRGASPARADGQQSNR